MQRERQSPPAANRGASNVNNDGDALSLTPLDDIARHVDGAFVVVVETTGGKYRRRCFLTAASAQRAAERALDRGESATVYMAQLKPLWKLQGGREAHVCSVECARTHGGAA